MRETESFIYIHISGPTGGSRPHSATSDCDLSDRCRRKDRGSSDSSSRERCERWDASRTSPRLPRGTSCSTCPGSPTLSCRSRASFRDLRCSIYFLLEWISSQSLYPRPVPRAFPQMLSIICCLRLRSRGWPLVSFCRASNRNPQSQPFL